MGEPETEKTLNVSFPRRATRQGCRGRVRPPGMDSIDLSCSYKLSVYGEVPEWSNGTVSKTVVRSRVPRVRIPPSPPHNTNHPVGVICVIRSVEALMRTLRFDKSSGQTIWSAQRLRVNGARYMDVPQPIPPSPPYHFWKLCKCVFTVMPVTDASGMNRIVRSETIIVGQVCDLLQV